LSKRSDLRCLGSGYCWKNSRDLRVVDSSDVLAPFEVSCICRFRPGAPASAAWAVRCRRPELMGKEVRRGSPYRRLLDANTDRVRHRGTALAHVGWRDFQGLPRSRVSTRVVIRLAPVLPRGSQVAAGTARRPRQHASRPPAARRATPATPPSCSRVAESSRARPSPHKVIRDALKTHSAGRPGPRYAKTRSAVKCVGLRGSNTRSAVCAAKACPVRAGIVV